MGERFSGWLVVEPWLFAAVQPQVTTASVHPRLRSFLWNAPSFLLVHIGVPSSNQATTLESQMIHMIQELFGQTLSRFPGGARGTGVEPSPRRPAWRQVVQRTVTYNRPSRAPVSTEVWGSKPCHIRPEPTDQLF